MTIATLAKLAGAGEVRRDERVVAMVTGHGLKTVEALSGTGTAGPTATIAPTLEAFNRAMAEVADRPGTPVTGRSPMITVRIPTQLRPLTGGAGEVTVEGATIGEVLKALDAAHQGFAERIFDDTGGLRRFVNVFLDDEDVRFLDGLATPVTSGQTVSIIPAVAGG